MRTLATYSYSVCYKGSSTEHKLQRSKDLNGFIKDPTTDSQDDSHGPFHHTVPYSSPWALSFLSYFNHFSHSTSLLLAP